MLNSNKSEKSRGILAFAHNTVETNYVGIANKTLELASKILQLPYTLITDTICPPQNNNRYNIDLNKFVEWRNVGRHLAYNLSPYDETLVIDVDYIIQDQSLLQIFDMSWDYILMRQSHALTQDYIASMGPNSLPFVWATVFAFRKTSRANMFFDLIDRVKNNYGYYRELFNIQERNFRNDYSFAIADIILNGYTIPTMSIPGSMLTVDQPIKSIKLVNNKFIIKDSKQAYITPRTNLHIMSKQYLESEDFSELVNEIKNVTP